MKLTWSKDKKFVILIAETPSEVAFCELIAADLKADRYMTATKGGKIIKARYSIMPSEGK